MKHELLYKISTLLPLLLFVGSFAQAADSLNAYNWGEYVAETTIPDFEKEFDVKVTYDNYDSMESVDAKMLAGHSGYDVVNHSGFFDCPFDQGRNSNGAG